ncbi:Glycosylphosphatidylinositol anchor biosynthesis protein 11 [Purpureocillium lavendulum]|uniref:Glycosylphosphatidylinositol anchor biosynthesis protein 11 n=1 Tax=Purpureocillium lavendulum TaxID=1247861 RepID=A0AB34FNK7_9HYPO|nr:Glycosylphosphatidylinositol anchor biosynthesis protein 11 [Purpureocillium lavendulum]
MVLLTDLVNAAFAVSSVVSDPASAQGRSGVARRDVKYLPRFANDAVQLHHTVKVAKGVVLARDTDAVEVPVTELVDILDKLHDLEKQVAALLPSGVHDDKKVAANGEECDVEHLLYYLGVNGTESKRDQVGDHPLFRRNTNCTMDKVAAEQGSGKNTAANTSAGSGDGPASAATSLAGNSGQTSNGKSPDNVERLSRPTSPTETSANPKDAHSGAILLESPEATGTDGSKKQAVDDTASPATKAPKEAEATEAANTLEKVYTTTIEKVATNLDGKLTTTTITMTTTSRVTVTVSRKLTVAVAQPSATDASQSPSSNSTKETGDEEATGDMDNSHPADDVTAAPSPSLKAPLPVGASQQYTNSTVADQGLEPETPAAESMPEQTTKMLMNTGDVPSGFKTISTPAPKVDAEETSQ